MKLLITILIFCVSSLPISAQALDRNYIFQDGIYLSFAAFQADQPDWPLDQLEGRLVTNEETGLTKSDFLAVKQDTGAMPLVLDEIWGICLDGRPYIRLQGEGASAGFATFALLRVRGAICYYRFDVEEPRYVEVKAYNPLTGRPFRRAKVRNTEIVTRHKILHFETGKSADLSQENLREWVSDDAPLRRTVAELADNEKLTDKLYRSLLVYNDRHPVYIGQKE